MCLFNALSSPYNVAHARAHVLIRICISTCMIIYISIHYQLVFEYLKQLVCKQGKVLAPFKSTHDTIYQILGGGLNT